MSEYTEAQAQADVDALIRQLEADPAARQALLDDPRATLRDAGVPDSTIDQVDEALAGGEVEGYTFEGVASPGMAVGLTKVRPGGAVETGTSVIIGGGLSTWLPTTSVSGRPGPA